MIDIYDVPKKEAGHAVIEFDKVSHYEKTLSELMTKGKINKEGKQPISEENNSNNDNYDNIVIKNTDFIEVSPVIRDRPKRVQKRTKFEDFELEYEIKSERLEHPKG